MNAVILLSGGLDSTTCMAVAKQQGYDLYPISFDYHQRNKIELEGAKEIAKFFGAKRHLIIDTNMPKISIRLDIPTKAPEIAKAIVPAISKKVHKKIITIHLSKKISN